MMAKHVCSCWRLTEPLADEPLPDHVCLETMIGTIAAAERDRLLPSPPVDDRWPLPVGRSHLGFVVRHWAPEVPNPTLAKPGVAGRADAVREAGRLGLVDPN